MSLVAVPSLAPPPTSRDHSQNPNLGRISEDEWAESAIEDDEVPKCCDSFARALDANQKLNDYNKKVVPNQCGVSITRLTTAGARSSGAAIKFCSEMCNSHGKTAYGWGCGVVSSPIKPDGVASSTVEGNVKCNCDGCNGCGSSATSAPTAKGTDKPTDEPTDKTTSKPKQAKKSPTAAPTAKTIHMKKDEDGHGKYGDDKAIHHASAKKEGESARRATGSGKQKHAWPMWVVMGTLFGIIGLVGVAVWWYNQEKSESRDDMEGREVLLNQ